MNTKYYVIIQSYDNSINEVKLADNPERAVDLALSMAKTTLENGNKYVLQDTLEKLGYIFIKSESDSLSEVYVTTKEVE